MVSAKEIPPGGEGTIEVALTTSGRSREYHKTVMVYSNDPSRPEVQLSIHAKISVSLSLSRNTVSFGQLSKDQQAVRYLTLEGRDRDQAEILSVECDSERLKVEFSKTGFDNDPAQQLRITLLPGIPVGRFNSRVFLRTNNPSTPNLTLLVSGEITGAIRVVPYRLNFTLFQKGVGAVRQIRLTTEKDPFKILSVSCTVPGLVTRVEELTAGTNYFVKVIVPADFAADAISGTVVIQTDNPEQQTIEVKVSGRARL